MIDIKNRLTNTCPFPQIFKDKDEGRHPKSEMGYFRADFDGHKWWNTVWPVHEDMQQPELIAEFDSIFNAFVDTFPTLADLEKYCQEHLTPTSDPTEYNAFLDLDGPGVYWLRLITRKRDYNLYLHCYNKNHITKKECEHDQNSI